MTLDAEYKKHIVTLRPEHLETSLTVIGPHRRITASQGSLVTCGALTESQRHALEALGAVIRENTSMSLQATDTSD